MLDTLSLQFGVSLILTFLISKVFLYISKPSKVAIKPELISTQAGKQGTPVIGGVAFTLGAMVASVVFPSFSDPLIWLPIVAMVLFGLIGLVDDRMKPHSKTGDGLSSLAKLVLQISASSVLLLIANSFNLLDTNLSVFGLTVHLGFWYYLFALLYILYFVNAVNITDGLDALASGSSIPLLLLIVVVSLIQGKVTSSAMLGSSLAFLYFNRRPARYFMGDSGSHALGSYLGVSALLLHAELLFFVASGLFLVEFASSLIQIIAIRKFGHKVFSIAPLHHAYELKGVSEGKIVASFTMLSWCFALTALVLMR